MENPEDFMVEEREKLMVSPTGGNPFLRKAHFLKPTLQSAIGEPLLKLTPSSSSLPPHFEPSKWPLKVDFRGWHSRHNHLKTWAHSLASVHQSTWKKAGIFDAIFNSTYNLRRHKDLAFALAEKWCSETNTFVFPWGEATITLEDVMVLGGFSVLGDSVLSPQETAEMKRIEEELDRERTKLYRYESLNTSPGLWVKNFIDNGADFEHEAFLAFWLSRYVFPDACEVINKHVFSIAIRLARGTRISLAPAVLASIYRDLGLLRQTIVASNHLEICDTAFELILKSPFNLVQVWAWERFLELRPIPNALRYAEPRIARWVNVDGAKYQNLRMILDSAGEDFEWRSYALAINNWHFPKYYSKEEKWVLVGPDLDDELLSFVRCLRVCELAGLGFVEPYLPHRVAMQFGFDQDLPCSVTRSNQSADIVWMNYIKEIKNVKLYLPSRLFEADVSTEYLKFWEQSAPALEDASEADVPGQKIALLMGDQPPLLLGRPPESNSMEDGKPVDEDKLTISEALKQRKKHENFEIRLDDAIEKSSVPKESSVNTIGGVVSPIGNDCSGSSSLSLFEKRLLEFEKRDSALEARFQRVRSVVDELTANSSGTTYKFN